MGVAKIVRELGVGTSARSAGDLRGRAMSDEMEEDALKARITAWLSNRGLEHTERYVQSGRHLRDVPINKLKERWAAAVKAWAVDLGMDCTARLDIESELGLRREELPRAAAKDALDAITRAASEAAETLKARPGEIEAFGADILASMEEFERTSKLNRS
jgi:hypothetical protein